MYQYLYGIISIHGGEIEPGTSAVARAIAGDMFPLYVNEQDPHITSTQFHDEALGELSQKCETLISIHGEKNREESFVIVGGLDHTLAEKIEDALFQHGFTERHYPHHLRGLDPHNVCNRGRSGKGVQLEISRKLRDELMNDKEKMERFVEAVKNALLEKDIFAEVGFGNETFLSTEVEQGDDEYRIKGFILPEKIKGIYLRFYIGRRNIILSLRNGLVIKKKDKSKFKILFGVYGVSSHFNEKNN